VSDQSKTDQPVGPVTDAKPVARPGPVALAGRFGRVERLAATHAPGLWEAIKGHDRLWTYLSYGPFADTGTFAKWVDSRIVLEDPYSYAILDRAGRAVGILTLMSIRPEHRVIEVGHVLYSPALQHTPLATEAQYLLARYAFETLRYRRYEWKCDALNAPSRRAALRYGFTYDGIFRQHLIVKGRNRDTAWFSMLDEDWPARKRNFETWLAAENFTADGRQKSSLAALNSGAE
jgi:RimJ/RimL family protein N-acetyltransferase